jgi:hypothetical protein
MAAKHDGKKARENMWVTHQNLARAKGGSRGYQFKERVPPKPTAPKAAAAKPSAVPAPAAEPAIDEAPAAPAPAAPATSDAKE